VFIVLFTSKVIWTLFPDTERIMVILGVVLVEHFIFGLKKVLDILIPDTPEWVTEEK
jgi:hypothetical protein